MDDDTLHPDAAGLLTAIEGCADRATMLVCISGALAHAAAEDAMALLREIEWTGRDAEGDPRCYFCGAWKDEYRGSHFRECRLAKLIGAPVVARAS